LSTKDFPSISNTNSYLNPPQKPLENTLALKQKIN